MHSKTTRHRLTDSRPDRKLSHWLQGRIHHELQRKVAGDDAQDRARKIWDTPGQRQFNETDPIWQVHTDAAMFPGGIRALLLQSLHPAAMAAVAKHSSYQPDPWGRLARTSTFLATTTFGTVEHSKKAIDIVKAVHAGIEGTGDDGTPYRASDPHLLRWVHVAEVDSFLTTHQMFGACPLTNTEADTFVAQSSHVAIGLGATEVPLTVADLKNCLRSYQSELMATPDAHDVTRFLIQPPEIPKFVWPWYGLILGGAIGSLPGWAREELHLGQPHIWVDGLLEVLGRTGVRAVRWAMQFQESPTRTV